MSDPLAVVRLNGERRRAKQEEELAKKVNEFLARAAAKLKEDTQDIPGLKEPPTVKLLSKDGRKMWVPRRILVARGQVFKRLLEEGQDTDVINLSKVSSKTLEVLVQYLESGTLHQDWRRIDVVVELCKAVGDYDLPVLLEFLKGVLVSLCNTEDMDGTYLVLTGMAAELGWEKPYQQMIKWIKGELANRRHMSNYLNQVSRRVDAENLRLREELAGIGRRRNNTD